MTLQTLDRGPTINIIETAFDAVIPGYARAFNTTICVARRRRNATPSPWHDKRRTRINRYDERNLLLYQVSLVSKPPEELRRQDMPAVPDDWPYPSLLLYNRAYAPLCLIVLDDPQAALEDLTCLRAEADKPRFDPSDRWLFTDKTLFQKRCDITLNVLAYLRDNARQVHPLWQDAPNLAGFP